MDSWHRTCFYKVHNNEQNYDSNLVGNFKVLFIGYRHFVQENKVEKKQKKKTNERLVLH